jgi:hypothetical protein
MLPLFLLQIAILKYVSELLPCPCRYIYKGIRGTAFVVRDSYLHAIESVAFHNIFLDHGYYKKKIKVIYSVKSVMDRLLDAEDHASFAFLSMNDNLCPYNSTLYWNKRACIKLTCTVV